MPYVLPFFFFFFYSTTFICNFNKLMCKRRKKFPHISFRNAEGNSVCFGSNNHIHPKTNTRRTSRANITSLCAQDYNHYHGASTTTTNFNQYYHCCYNQNYSIYKGLQVWWSSLMLRCLWANFLLPLWSSSLSSPCAAVNLPQSFYKSVFLSVFTPLSP